MRKLSELSREEALAVCAQDVVISASAERIDDVQVAMSAAGFDYVGRQEAFNALADAFENVTAPNVAYIAGEPHSDHPECVSPVIGAFMRTWNDDLGDEDRDRLLKPYLTKVIGTKNTKEVEDARGWLAVQWQINCFVPAWLDLAGLNKHATFLRELQVNTRGDLHNAFDKIKAADSAARSAADSAADSAAYWAAEEILKPTVFSLQQSACDLLDAMLALGETS